MFSHAANNITVTSETIIIVNDWEEELDMTGIGQFSLTLGILLSFKLYDIG